MSFCSRKQHERMNSYGVVEPNCPSYLFVPPRPSVVRPTVPFPFQIPFAFSFSPIAGFRDYLLAEDDRRGQIRR